MAAEDCWLTSEIDASTAVCRFLDDFAGSDRAQAVHLVLKQLRRRIEPDRVLACELAWEVHAGSYWSQLQDDGGRPYESEEAYFRNVLGLASWRTAYKRLSMDNGRSGSSSRGSCPRSRSRCACPKRCKRRPAAGSHWPRANGFGAGF